MLGGRLFQLCYGIVYALTESSQSPSRYFTGLFKSLATSDTSFVYWIRACDGVLKWYHWIQMDGEKNFCFYFDMVC